MSFQILDRRRLLTSGGVTFGALAAGGCDALSNDAGVRDAIGGAESLSYRTQRLLQGREALAREFSEADISPVFKANGTLSPDTARYRGWLATGFADWRLAVGGLVLRPLSLSLAELVRLPARSQITRHDCVEGWSAIGKWTGVRLSAVLRAAGVAPEARYIVFRCADELERRADRRGFYYESIDLIDAFHPQTLLAHSLNGRPLDVGHGAPLRLRVERQLGYKQAKYLTGIDVVASLAGYGRGRGGFWEDRGYEWYAGI